MALIACVEDDEKIAANLVLRLREAGHGVVRFASGEEAFRWLRDGGNAQPDMLLVDVRLPAMSGIDLLGALGAERPPTVIISGEASMAETIEAMRLGVHDFLDKPIGRERLLKTVQNCLELAAALHRQSRRRAGPFVKINCAAIPAHLIEDELFGHARGAFTDAKSAKAGLFEQAHGGTLLLDEIGDMDPGLQSRLLRVIEDGRVRRLGETTERAVDVRLLAST